MSLLDKGRETVTVYQEIETTDADGNTITKAGPTGVVMANATVQLLAQSGTSSRRAEQDNEGFESEQVYRLRPPRSWTIEIGAQSKVEWRGVMWSILGKPRRYNGSDRTYHTDYIIRRN
jgi:hypothetical protein